MDIWFCIQEIGVFARLDIDASLAYTSRNFAKELIEGFNAVLPRESDHIEPTLAWPHRTTTVGPLSVHCGLIGGIPTKEVG
jgi:hypothetical protein